jgi:hypothetical protein
VEIGGVRGGKERLLEEELELFNGTISRNPNGGGFPGYRPDLDFSRIAPRHSSFFFFFFFSLFFSLEG